MTGAPLAALVARYAVDELLAYLPEPAAAPRAEIVPRDAAVSAAPGDRPGDRLEDTPGALEAILQYLGCEPLGPARGDETHWRKRWPDNGESDVSVYAAGGGKPARAVIWGADHGRDWGIPDGHPQTAWDLLGAVACGGDYSLAARIVARAGDSGEAVVAALADRTHDELAAAYPKHEVVTPGRGPLDGRDVPGIGSIRGATSLAEALASPTPVWVPVADDPSRFVVVDTGRAYGVFRTHWTTKYKKGEEHEVEETERIATWVPWRSRVTQTLLPRWDGTAAPVGEALADVTLLTARGRRVTLPGLSARDADSIRTIVAVAGAGVEIPENRTDVERLANALRQLGHEEVAQEAVFVRTGWVYDDAHRIVFAAPAGSVDATGPRPDIRVVAPLGSTDGWLDATTLGEVTVANLPASLGALETAVASVKDLFAIAPNRPDLIVAALGALWAAPLRLKVRGVPFPQGPAGSGKSILAALLTAYQTATAGVNTKKLPITLTRSSEAGVQVVTGWAADLVVACDDYRTEGLSRIKVEQTIAATVAAIQRGYGDAEEAKGTRDGGARTSRPAEASTFVTGELAPDGEGMTGRAVHALVSAGDILTEGEDCALDIWRRRYEVETANRLWSSYVRWLARQIEAHPNGLAGWAADNDAWRTTWATKRAGRRAAITVSSLATGWDRLYRFAAEEGVADLLPSRRLVDEALEGLVSGNIQAASEQSIGQRLVNRLAAMIEGGEGHLVTLSNEKPADASRWGWGVRRVDANYEPAVEAGGRRLGWISGDGTDTDPSRRIVISPSGMQAAWEGAMGAMPWNQPVADRSLRALVETYDGAVVTKRRFGSEPRRTGYTFALDTLAVAAAEEPGIPVHDGGF